MVGVQTMLLNADGKFHQMHSGYRALALAATSRVTVIYWWENETLKSFFEEFPIPALMVYHKFINLHQPFKKATITRESLIQRDNYTCLYCGQQFGGSQLTLDHIIPRSRGGKTTWLNCVLACKNCNNRKGNRTPEEAEMPLLKKPYIPKFTTIKTLTAKRLSGKVHESWLPYLSVKSP